MRKRNMAKRERCVTRRERVNLGEGGAKVGREINWEWIIPISARGTLSAL